MSGRDIGIFIIGFAAGVGVTYVAIKDYFQKQSDDAIADYKAAHKSVHAKRKKRNEDKKEYDNIIQQYKTDNVDEPEHVNTIHEEPGNDEDTPKIEYVSPYDFGEKEGYDILSYTYYDDGGKVADSDDKLVDNPEELFGNEFKNHFGQYDSCYIRNHELKADIEVLMDVRTYEEAMDIVPHP